MRVSDNLSVSMRNLFKRKVRTALTLLAVSMATMLIVSVVALGIGMSRSFEESLKNMSDITKIQIYNYEGGGKVILDNDVDQIAKLPGVQAATPLLQTNLYAIVGKRTGNIQLYGIRPEAFEAMKYPIKEGEGLDPNDEWSIVFGDQTPMEFMTNRERAARERAYRNGTYDWNAKPEYTFDILEGRDKLTASVDWNYTQPNQNVGGEEPPPDQATEQARPPKPYTLHPVGILNGETSWEYQYQSYMNIETVKKIYDDQVKFQTQQGNRGMKRFREKGYEQILVKAEDIKYVEGLVEQIKEMGYQNVYSPIDYITELKKTSENMQGFLGIIGGVVLAVAVLMVANTMIMSIYERTREIGVMKVIGASLKDIRNMFLTEAAAIGIIGGAIGLGFSYAVSFVIQKFPQLLRFMQSFTGYGEATVTMAIPPYLAVLALVGATFVGLASGYFPARRAMHVSALTAILEQS